MAKYCQTCEYHAERHLYPAPRRRVEARAVQRRSPAAVAVTVSAFWFTHAALVQLVRGEGVLAIFTGPFAWLLS